MCVWGSNARGQLGDGSALGATMHNRSAAPYFNLSDFAPAAAPAVAIAAGMPRQETNPDPNPNANPDPDPNPHPHPNPTLTLYSPNQAWRVMRRTLTLTPTRQRALYGDHTRRRALRP